MFNIRACENTHTHWPIFRFNPVLAGGPPERQTAALETTTGAEFIRTECPSRQPNDSVEELEENY